MELNEDDIKYLLHQKKTNITSGIIMGLFICIFVSMLFLYNREAGALSIPFMVIALIFTTFIPIIKNEEINNELKCGGKISFKTKVISHFQRTIPNNEGPNDNYYYIILEENKLSDIEINQHFFNDINIGDEIIIEIGIKSHEILKFQSLTKNLIKYRPSISNFKNGKSQIYDFN